MPNNTSNGADVGRMHERRPASLAVIGAALAAVPLWVSNVTGWLAYVFTFGLWAGLAAIIAAVVTAISGRRQICGPVAWSGVGALFLGLALVTTAFSIIWTSTGSCAPGGDCFNPVIQQAQMFLRAAAVVLVAGAILLGLDRRRGTYPVAATEPLK